MNRPTRRDLLRAASFASIVALPGCSDLGDLFETNKPPCRASARR